MAEPSRSSIPEVEVFEETITGEFETNVLTKSDHPKTPREVIKMIINLFVNFFLL